MSEHGIVDITFEGFLHWVHVQKIDLEVTDYLNCHMFRCHGSGDGKTLFKYGHVFTEREGHIAALLKNDTAKTRLEFPDDPRP